MPFSYFIGFLPTIISTIILAIIYFVWLFMSSRRITKDIYGEPFEPGFWDVVLPIMKSIALAASYFLLVYPILNLVLQILIYPF